MNRRSWLAALAGAVLAPFVPRSKSRWRITGSCSTLGRTAKAMPDGYWSRVMEYQELPDGSVVWTSDSGERFVKVPLEDWRELGRGTNQQLG